MRDGRGEIIYRNGDTFRGLLKQNHVDGEGVLNLTSTGCQYSGEFVLGKVRQSNFTCFPFFIFPLLLISVPWLWHIAFA